MQDLPCRGDVQPQSRKQGCLVKVKVIVVMRSGDGGADAHVGGFSAVGLDLGHQVGGVLGAGPFSAGCPRPCRL